MDTLEKPLTKNWEIAFCISLAFCVAIFFDYASNVSFGYWIPMTVTIILAPVGQGAIIRSALARVSGAFFGVTLGFLYANVLMMSSYQWIYALPFIWFISYYFYFVTNNYIIYATMIALFVPILSAASDNAFLMEYGLPSIYFTRFSFTILGAFIAISSIYMVHRNSFSSERMMKVHTDNIFKMQADIIQIITKCFFDATLSDKELVKKIESHLLSMTSTENIYLNIAYELEHNDNKELFYQYLFKVIQKLLVCSRKLLCISNHCTYSGTISNKDELQEILNALAEKYNNMDDYFAGKSDRSSEQISLILEKLNDKDKFAPEYLFIETAREISKLADETAHAVFNKSYLNKQSNSSKINSY